MKRCRIPNWHEYQHYKNRNPPWVKLHTKTLDNELFEDMPDSTKAHWMLMWIIASRTDNDLRFDAEWVARKIGANTPVDLPMLVERGFIEVFEDDRKPQAPRKPPASKPHASPKALPRTKPNSAFLDLDAFKAAYPKRAGSQPWLKAATAATARMKEGCTFDSMVDGAKRYAAFCEASEQLNTKFVMQASTFLGPERHFLEAWDPPTEEVDVLGEAMAANEEAIRRERAGAQGVRQPDHVGDEAWQGTTIEATGVEVPTRLLLEDAE